MDATYYYRARTPEGLAVRGSMSAGDAEAVFDHLRSRALFVTSIRAGDSLGGRLEQIRALSGLKTSSIVVFFRSFATMLAAGVPMQRVLRVQIAQAGDRRLREALLSVLSDVESGRSLSAALRTRPREFPRLFVAMIEAGESGGMLDTVLDRLATMLERGHALQRRVTASLAYPAIVLVAAILLLGFLVTTIVPAFGRLFDQLNAPVPAPARALMAAGRAIDDPRCWFGVFVLAAAATAAVLAAKRSRAVMDAGDRLRLSLPVVGPILRHAITARVMRVFGSLLRCGVDVLKAVEIVTPLTGSSTFSQALRRLSISLREGDSVAEPLERSGVFDPFTIAMVRVGEESGSLDSMLVKIAEHYEAEVEAALLTLGATIEPLLIFFVGLLVAGIVFSVFIPMYSLVGQIH